MSATENPWGLPEARVLRHGDRRPPGTGVGRELRDLVRPGPRAQVVLGHVFGLWPLIAVVAVAIALLWSAAVSNSP